MRTKTLLALAAFVASVLPSMAQVYSANIVGYYQVPTPGNLTAMCVSLTKGANKANEVIPYSIGDNVQVWTGVNWQMFAMDDLSGTGWADSNGGEVPLASLPTLGLGKGFFYGKATAIANVTITGDVLKGTNTIALASGLTAVGSQLPIGGLVNAAGNATISGVNLQVPLGGNVQFWNGVGWTMYVNDDLSSTGWADSNGGEVPAPTLTVGQGFFFNNPGTTMNWSQWYNF